MTGAGDRVGLSGLAVLAVGLLLFLLSVFAARRGAGGDRSEADATRSRRSWIGVAVQGMAFLVACFGVIRIGLDPLGAPALGEAAVIAVLVAVAVALFVWASRTMGRNWSIVARTREDHSLVTDGPFALVRHPIYLSLLLWMLALAIGFGHAGRLWLAVPLYMLGTWLRIVEEERLLRASFGPAYDSYAARVKRFIPGVF